MAELIEPDFERDRIEGQLSPMERRALYDCVMRLRPDCAFEVGTCRGGGSTYFIASALRNIDIDTGKKVVLQTTETDIDFYEYASELYGTKLQYLSPYVNLHLCGAMQTFAGFEMPGRGFAFLDGAENASETLHQFSMFDMRLNPGSMLAFHDWTTSKTDSIRPIMEDHQRWLRWKAVDSHHIFRKEE
jgi:cephalosporin hydroxylase